MAIIASYVLQFFSLTRDFHINLALIIFITFLTTGYHKGRLMSRQIDKNWREYMAIIASYAL
jgi:ABC-type iron transport system FetAB permease component